MILHGLETCEHPRDLLLEVYRVLGPGGRALFIVPNRLGLWARRDSTPFALGSPYSLGQLETRGKYNVDFCQKLIKLLYFSPRVIKSFGKNYQQVGKQLRSKLSRHFAGGVLMLEVYKQIPAPTRPGIR